jgi:enamine deaminase RidA (YjgF/YER057c/UK114 family)
MSADALSADAISADAIEQRLRELGIELPTPPKPAANYVPYTISGKLIFIAGQVPVRDGKLVYRCKVGRGVSPEQAKEAARLVAINLLAVARAAAGDLARVRCVRLGGFVNCTDDFEHHPEVLNGASDLMVAVLGERGRHARTAVGTNVLPFDVTVEIDAVFELVE